MRVPRRSSARPRRLPSPAEAPRRGGQCDFVRYHWLVGANLRGGDGTCVDGVQEPKECAYEDDGACDPVEYPTLCPVGTDLADCAGQDGFDVDNDELRAARTAASTPEGEFEPTGFSPHCATWPVF